MTFCLGMRVHDGLVGIADTRITTGHECITARKLTTYAGKNYSVFFMTSGLRSVRDKALTYFDDAFPKHLKSCDRLFKVCNLFAEQLRRVAVEDKESLLDDGMNFNMHAIIGGQMAKDPEPKLYHLYPAGTWVEVGVGTPYTAIGNSGYGKPILDRTLHYEDTMSHAFRVGCLAFDSTRISAADVDYPVDIILYPGGSYEPFEVRFRKEDLQSLSDAWQERLRKAIIEMPFSELEKKVAGHLEKAEPKKAKSVKTVAKAPAKRGGRGKIS